jgi:hypothetical protein
MLHRVLGILGALLLVLLVSILFRQSKAKQCVLFSAYVIAAALFTTLILLFPAHYSPQAYMVKQGIYDSLLFGMSLELAIRTFAAFTGIARFVRMFLGGAVAVSTAGILLATPANPGYDSFMRFQPGITTAGIWCLAFVGLLIVRYQIPVPAFTRAIILGYVPYLVVFTVYIDLINRWGWSALPNLNLLNAIAYDMVAGYWVYSALQKD